MDIGRKKGMSINNHVAVWHLSRERKYLLDTCEVPDPGFDHIASMQGVFFPLIYICICIIQCKLNLVNSTSWAFPNCPNLPPPRGNLLSQPHIALSLRSIEPCGSWQLWPLRQGHTRRAVFQDGEVSITQSQLGSVAEDAYNNQNQRRDGPVWKWACLQLFACLL